MAKVPRYFASCTKVHFKGVQTLIDNSPSFVPSEISKAFDETVKAVYDTLESAQGSIKGSFSTAFEGGNRSSLRCFARSGPQK